MNNYYVGIGISLQCYQKKKFIIVSIIVYKMCLINSPNPRKVCFTCNRKTTHKIT